MKRYTVTGNFVTLDGGSRVTLTAAQAKTRMHNLKCIDGDVHEVLRPIQMKHGEQFGYSGDIHKNMESSLSVDGGDDNVESADAVATGDPLPPVPRVTQKTRR